MDWRIWYEDGSTFTNADGPPEASPPWGVIAIGQRTHGRYQDALYSGVPWYVFRADEGYWCEYDDGGFLDCMVHRAKDVTAVRFGRYTRRDRFQAVMREVGEWVYGQR